MSNRPFRFGAGAARNRIHHFFTQTYTRQAPVDIPTDPVVESGRVGPWGEQVEDYEPISPLPRGGHTATKVPCLLQTVETTELGPDGFVLLRMHRLFVDADDPVSNGYRVSNVQDQTGRVVLHGPIMVLDVTDQAPTGMPVYTVVTMIERRTAF